MNVQDVVGQFLEIADEEERRAFLLTLDLDLPLEFFLEMKARSDTLLLKQPEKALAIAEAALQATSFACTPLAEAVVKWSRGNALFYLGRFERALDDYSRACATYDELGEDRLAVARLQANMVFVLTNLGRYDEALNLAKTAREALQPWGQSKYLATLEMNVGSTYRVLGRYADSLASYERGRTIFDALGNQVQTARMDINRARALVCLDRFREAEDLLQEARCVLVEEGQTLAANRADLNLATLLSRQGYHRRALEAYSRVRSVFAELGDKIDVAVTDLYRTYDYLALNLLPEALDLATEAQDTLAQQEMPRYVALAAGNRAAAARKVGYYADALDALLSAQAAFAEMDVAVEVALLDVERAMCLCEMGDREAGSTVAMRAIEVLASHDLPLRVACARLTLADCLLASQDVDRASSLYSLALDQLGEIPSLAWRAHDGLGQVAEIRKQTKKAYRHYGEAIACIERVEEELGVAEYRSGFLDDKLDVYKRAVSAALALGKLEAAFNHVERSKTGVWRDFLAQKRTKNERRGQLRALREEWHWLYNRLTRPDDDEQILRGGEAEEANWTSLRALERQIADARRESGQVLQGYSPLSLSMVRQRLPAGTLLLDYYCATDEVIVFLISPTDVHVLDHAASVGAVGRAINRWRFNVESASFSILDGQSPPPSLLDEAQDTAHTLYQLLIEPLKPHLAGCRSLWIIPHGPLWSVPFAALYDGRQYLMENFELTYLPGLVLLEQSERRDATTLLDAPLVVGHSHGGRLLCSVGEAQAVADALGKARLLLEDEASTERLRTAASSCTLLHLATHGFFRSDAPLFSALYLVDGWLMAGDLDEWDLSHTELAVLSACETGVSLSRGSDLLGLAHGFFRAGARQLLVSLWAVDDASTADLMTRFYEMLHGDETVTSAWRKAQIAVLEQHRHPFYWAGFVPMVLI